MNARPGVSAAPTVQVQASNCESALLLRRAFARTKNKKKRLHSPLIRRRCDGVM
jgi:hypothetical protein